LLQESADYARDVGEALRKTQVYEALRHLAQGFLDYSGNRLVPDPETVRELYDNSLIVLYRLLFIQYAEARDLLPVRESEMYRDTYSLHAIKHEVAQERKLLPTSATLWLRLKELFHIINEGINEGSPPLVVATFDGGLFDPLRHSFLEEYAIANAHLQKAIDLLSRIGGEFVDYRDLAERHLGTIYEGLLEFQLEPLPEPEEGWTVGFNDRGGRKATGSYYTPGYVVEYIIEETVEPLLREAVAGKEGDEQKIDAVLGLNVLDPSMGSGHFLVEATERIARFLVELNVAPDEVKTDGEAELAYWKRRVAQSCVYGVDFNPLAVELAKLSLWLVTVAKDRPLSFLDHHLRTGNALLGARISDLQPGSTRKKGRRTHGDGDAQLSMTRDPAFRDTMSAAVGGMWRIEESPAETVEEVRYQESIYTKLRGDLTSQYVRLANLITATHFGVKADIYPEFWSSLVEYAALNSQAANEAADQNAALSKYREWLDAAAKEAEEQRFFQWELEFPEVYFDRWGRPLDDAGFDVVVGNPPYLRQERLKSFKPYFRENFDSYKSGADLYMLFYEQGLRLLRKAGRLAYISSGTFARADFASELRNLLPTMAQIESVIDFGEKQPFDGAEMVRPTITVLKKGRHEVPFRSFLIFDEVPQSLEQALSDGGEDSDPAALQLPEWVFQPATLTQLFIKIREVGRPLEDVVDGRMHRGVLTGLNEAFIIDQSTRDSLVNEDPSCAAVIKPVLRGEDLRPWYQEDEGRWLIVLPSGWTHAQFGPKQSEPKAWEQFHTRHAALADYLGHSPMQLESGKTRASTGGSYGRWITMRRSESLKSSGQTSRSCRAFPMITKRGSLTTRDLS
jgi:type I restriction-modification system DNA methylase subunit